MNKNKPYPLQDHLENFQYGLSIVKEFLELNEYRLPEININEKTKDKHKGSMIYGGVGFPIIELNISNCKKPQKNPSYSWSYTGFKSDITPAGVLAHEIGHYIDYLSGWTNSSDFDWSRTKDVTSAEYDDKEHFAETMRLFILNPDLLKVGSKKRYLYITEELGLIPVIKETWKEVLSNSNEKFISSCETWFKRRDLHSN